VPHGPRLTVSRQSLADVADSIQLTISQRDTFHAAFVDTDTKAGISRRGFLNWLVLEYRTQRDTAH
jgi:hypothetical protein